MGAHFPDRDSFARFGAIEDRRSWHGRRCLVEATAGSTGVELSAAADNEEELEQRVGQCTVDVLVVECPAVTRTTGKEVKDLMQALKAPVAVVVYWFGNQQHVEGLQSRQIEVLRAPLEPAELHRAIARVRGDRSGPVAVPEDRVVPTASEPLPPRLSRESLARMAVASPNATCGCQKNLVDVALSLRALEDYLSGCESRSPEDEALHRALWQKVGEARSNIEDAIEHFAAVEGIEL